jgi:multiple sugar transport system permease protein
MKNKGYLLYLLPAAILVTFAELFPTVYTLGLSLFRWDLITPAKFTGFDNFKLIFSNAELFHSLVNTFWWLIGTLAFPVLGALLLAQFIYSLKRNGIFKTVFFLPTTLAPSIAGVICTRMLATRQGALNSILMNIFGIEAVCFMVNPDVNTLYLILVWTWQSLGLNLLLFLVGLDTVDRAPQEAAVIDGANSFQVFLHVRLPLLRPITLLVVSNSIINALRMFDIPWIMTQGGPGRASETLAVTLYKESFLLFHMGLGSAIAVIISLLSLSLSARFFLKN